MEVRLLIVHRQRPTVEATRFKNRLQGLLDLAWSEFLLRQAAPERRLEIQGLLARWALVRRQLAELEDRITASPG